MIFIYITMTTIIRKIVQTRPSLSVNFFYHSKDVIDKINDFANKGRSNFYKLYESEDGYTLTSEQVFYDILCRDELGNDPLIEEAMNKRRLYCKKYNIKYEVIETVE
jgi:hypothetical protein